MTLFRYDDEEPREPRWMIWAAVSIVVPIVATSIAAIVIGGYWLLRTIACS